MVQRHADGRTEGTGARMKRRGLIAGAAALAAGVMAKAASQPVAAANLTIVDSSDPSVLIINRVITPLSVGPDFAFTTNFGSHVLSVSTSSRADIAIRGDGRSYGIQGTGAYGVVGEGTGIGVFAKSANIGVQGYVPGDGTIQGAVAVQGVNQSTAAGGTGVQGQIPAGAGANTTAIQATNQSTGAGGKGVYALVNGGTATGTIGIYGANTTNAPNSHGIVGLSQHGHGLIGTCNAHPAAGNTYAGLVGFAGVPDANAGNFYGNVAVGGNLIVTGSQTVFGAKSAALAHPDGSHRLVYCVEAPESWLEDFGTGTLVNGNASIKLDPDFAAVADLSSYHVFLTTYADSGNGHFVTSRSAGGFVVQERNKGTGSGQVSWRVVAKRKDVKANRLAKFSLPPLTPPTIPPPHVPDVPTTPVPLAPKNP
jgi:hypothetical protein